MANTQKKKNALAKREKASNPQTNTVTATMRGVTSHRAAGSWGRGSGQARHGGRRWGIWVSACGGMSQAATEWNVLSIDIWFTTKKKGSQQEGRNWIKRVGKRAAAPSRSLFNCRGLALVPLCLRFEFRSHCQSFCSDFTVALSKTEKTSTVRGGDSVLFVVLRYVSIRFISFRFSSVSSLSLFFCRLCFPLSAHSSLPSWRYCLDA